MPHGEKVTGAKRVGHFKIRLGDEIKWYLIEKTHYPKVKWWATSLVGNPPKHCRDSVRIPLTDELWSRLEGWL